MKFTLAYWCLFIMACLPFVATAMAKMGGIGKRRKEGGYDNNDPRAWQAKQTGLAARASGAEKNTFEALPFFFAAVIVAHQLGALQSRLDLLAGLFVVLRVLYIVMYVGGLGTLRSLIWFGAFGVNIGILFLAA